MARTPEVTFLVVLKGDRSTKKKIMPAGPTLDFRHPRDFVGHSFDGLRASEFVELSSEPTLETSGEQPAAGLSSDQASDRKATEQRAVDNTRARLQSLEEKNAILESRLDRARTHLQNQKELIAQLKRKESALHEQIRAYEEAPGLSNSDDFESDPSRLADLKTAEDELINRMDEYMRKEAELEQREDLVREREQALDDTTIYFQQSKSAS